MTDQGPRRDEQENRWDATQPPPPFGATGPDSGAWEPPQYPPYFSQPGAPFGYDPATGVPFSPKSRLGAGLLNILVAGVGRMYAGQIGLGIAQLLVAIVTCGLGWIWSLIDGILILINGGHDEHGRPLRP
ncbi:TM2 domain-containing protein [Hoyosella altamirensis]|uniref:Putative lipid-binding transport protein (Tim44 family) n=1 Tax=Hoyosella altamirensis TaxID=616997 RepID=A0A839RJR6_9ACTN|nr:TM2 domain-containing protein [Hoyosella altamirensis]MBB3036424.1 putative lipid-binding transport protein (Tim44 family) [Hoyosella altamirensis]